MEPSLITMELLEKTELTQPTEPKPTELKPTELLEMEQLCPEMDQDQETVVLK